MMMDTVPKRQRTQDEILGAAKPGTEVVEVKEADKVLKIIDVTEPAASSERGGQVVEGMRKVREAMYPVCLFHSINYQDIVDEHGLTHSVSLLNFIVSVLSDQPYDVRRGRENANVYYYVLALVSMADVAELFKRVN